MASHPMITYRKNKLDSLKLSIVKNGYFYGKTDD